MSEKLDLYYPNYCDFSKPEFLESLGLASHERSVLTALLPQHDPENRCTISELVLDSLCVEGRTPFESTRALHTLAQKRVIFSEFPESVQPPIPSAAVVDQMIARAVQSATPTDTDIPYMETPDVDPEPSPSTARRVLLNIEYSVVYFCLQEESVIQETPDIIETLLPVFYASIRAEGLGLALQEANLLYVLELLQHVQRLFHQPLTEVRLPVPEEIPDEDTEV